MTKSVIFGVIFLIAGSGFASADQGVQRPVGGNLIHAQAVVAPESTKRIARLSETLQIAGILSVMRQEGFDYGKTLEEDMFPGKGGASWNAAVDKIYDEQAMRTVFDKALFSELGQADAKTLSAIEDFFGSERGQRILTLEVEARRALLDPETEEAAKAHADDLAAKNDPRLKLIRDFATTNDLVEMNVTGALNANLAFFKGMAAAGGFDKDMSESQMLENVWSQEPAIRTETEVWLYPYLAMAYQPLSDDDMKAYLEFSKIDAGKVLNSAVFAAFNVLFTDISGNLGRAAAKQIDGEDI